MHFILNYSATSKFGGGAVFGFQKPYRPMQCIETTWENGFVNLNFVNSNSNFHGLILKIYKFLEN